MGRLERTLFTLDWISDPALRRGIARYGEPEEVCCRFRFQSGTGGLREIKALREMSPATFSVSIETGSKFFRFQLGLIDRLIDHTMNGCRVSSTTQTTHGGRPTTSFRVLVVAIAAATLGAIGSKLANARAGHGWHNRKSLRHAQRARRGSG